MNAALWQCRLRPSRQARLLHGALTASALLLVAAAPLPALFWLLKLPLLVAMAGEAARQQQRLARRQGALQHHGDGSWRWQGARWRTLGAISWLPGAALLKWRSDQGKVERLWLLRDMMSRRAWRQLRARLLCRAAGE